MDNKDKYFGLMLTAVFFYNACWILDALAVFLLGGPVHPLLHVFFLLLTMGTGAVLFALYFLKSGFGAMVKKTVIATFFSIVLLVLFVSVSSLLLTLWSRILIPSMARPGMSNDILGAGVFLVLAFVLNCLCLFTAKTCCLYIGHGIGLCELGVATLASLKQTWQQRGAFMRRAVILFGLLILFCLLNDVLIKLLSGILPGIFLAKFLWYIIVCLLRASLVVMVLRMCLDLNRIVNGQARGLDGGTSIQGLAQNALKNAPKKLPLFAVAVLVITIAVGILSVPGSLNGPESLLNDIEYRMLRADLMMQDEQSRQAVAEWAKAEADLDSLQKYLKKILLNKGEDVDAPLYGISSKHIYPGTAYDDYFNVLLAFGEETGEGTDKYNAGNLYRYIDAVPETAIWAYGYYKEKGEKLQALKMFNAVVMQGVFTDRFVDTRNNSVSKLKELLARAEELQEDFNHRKVYSYMERAKYEDRTALLGEINNFIVTYAGDEELYAFAASLAEETAQGDTEYAYMKEYALKYYESAELIGPQETAGVVEFVTYMLYRSLHKQEAVDFARERYLQYPGNTNIALNYANALMESRNHAESNEILATIKEDRPYKDYLMAINYLELDAYERSLDSADKLEQALAGSTTDNEAMAQIEFYIYGYILEGISYLERDNDSSGSDAFGEKARAYIRVAENREQGSLAYDNVVGLKYWFTQKYDQSNALFESALKKYPELVYPYLMIGVNYLEKEEVEEAGCSKLAEKYLVKYIEKRPDAEEAYFCLGHIYKYQNDPVKAKRAFNKVMAILPYHNYDYDAWGISYHSRDTILGLDGEL